MMLYNILMGVGQVNDPFARGRLHGPVGNLIAHCGTIIRYGVRDAACPIRRGEGRGVST